MTSNILASCPGAIDVTLKTDVVGGQDCQGYNYLWNYQGHTESSLDSVGSGTFSVTVTDLVGCTAVARLTITSGIVPVVNLGSDVTVCPVAPHTFYLQGYNYDRYVWSTGETSRTNITVSDVGTYGITATSEDGCQTKDSVRLLNHVLDQDFITSSTGSLDLCEGRSLTLQSDPALSSINSWSTTATTRDIDIDTGGIFWLSAVDKNKCSVSDTVEVNFLPGSPPTINPAVICFGSQAVLSTSETYTAYVWSTGSTNDTCMVSTADSYTVTVTDSLGCIRSSPAVLVAEVQLPVPVLDSGNSKLYTSQPFASYQWLRNDTVMTGKTGDTLVPPGGGSYSVIVTDTNGCSSTSNTVVVGIEQQARVLTGLSVYPNPSEGIVHLQTQRAIDFPVRVEVWDMYGKMVRAFQMAHLMKEVGFELSDLAAGPYLMRITTIQQNKTRQTTIRFALE
jgi:hypothetical protein